MDNTNIIIKNTDGLSFLNSIEDGTIDLILTDPPYIISKETGMNKHYDMVKYNYNNAIDQVKTEEEWIEYKKTLKKPLEELNNNCGKGWSKDNYIKYGSIFGKKYCNRTMYGEWDETFTMEELDKFIQLFYSKLRNGGTIIIWFDIWKISLLKDLLIKHKFKQLRLIEWIKTNPQPINSKLNYLNNSREIAILAIKGSKPTFNSSYDNGIYYYPLASGKYKFHPTQKNLQLFEELIRKHSKENDTVLDTFLGGGTTAYACLRTKRKFIGCEIKQEYYDNIMNLLKKFY